MTAQDLKNAEDLIRSYNANYNSSPRFKALFDYYLQRPNLAAFRGKSLRDYVKIISSFSISSIYKSYSQRKPTPDNIKELLGKFYRSQEFIRLQQASSVKQPAEIEKADVTEPKKEAKKGARTPSFLKGLSSRTQTITRSAVDKTTSGLKSFSSNLGSQLLPKASQLRGKALNTGARLAGRAGLSALNGLNRAGMGVIRGLVISGPWGWVILGVILVIFVLFPIILVLLKTNSLLGLPDGSIVSTGPGGPGSVSSKLEISKTTSSNRVDNPDPADPSKGVISYTIKVTYKYTGTAKVEVSDTIPSNTEFVEASENPTMAASLVKWLIDSISTNQSKEFNLKLRATRPDTIVENTAQAKILSVTTPTPIPAPTGISATDFDSLMQGHGRLNSFGGEDNFITKVVGNGNTFRLLDKESYLRQIYKASRAKQLNPLIVLVIWGVEQGFGLRQPYLGCLGSGATASFDTQLNCAVNTLDRWMNHFDRIKDGSGIASIDKVDRGGRPTGEKCFYNDPFLYAYEMYTPVCHFEHGNEHARRNFVRYYNQLGK